MAGRKLTPSLREEFKKPVGRDISDSELKTIHAEHKLITVGDVVSLTAYRLGAVPILAVYDGMTERHGTSGFADLVKSEGLAETVVENPAATITDALDSAVSDALAGRSAAILRVIGEEDLALLPCILHAPEGAVVVYGWPGRGMKAVDTDGPSRAYIRHLLESMEEI